MAVAEVCRSVGFNTDEMLAAVELYPARNQVVHANLATLIKIERTVSRPAEAAL